MIKENKKDERLKTALVHDITDNILNHIHLYTVVEIYSTQVSNLGKRSSHMHVEV
jgi:hypothetical protein